MLDFREVESLATIHARLNLEDGLGRRVETVETIHHRFLRWDERDRWGDILRAAAVEQEDIGGILDASIVRAHQDASGGHGGPKKTI